MLCEYGVDGWYIGWLEGMSMGASATDRVCICGGRGCAVECL